MQNGRSQDAISLAIRPNKEVCRADVRESGLGVERPGPRIPLPNAQPQSASAKLHRRCMHRAHELLGQAASLPGPIHIKPMELDGGWTDDARRRSALTHLGVAGQIYTHLQQDGDVAGVGELTSLLANTIGGLEMSGHVLGPIIGTECLLESPGGERGKGRSINQLGTADTHAIVSRENERRKPRRSSRRPETRV